MSRIVSDKITTPRLRLLYNGLVTPYYHEDGAKKGKYSITLVASPAEIEEWREQMDEVHESLIARLCEQENKKKLPRKDPLGGIYPQVTREGEETGDLCVKLAHSDKGMNPKTGKEWDIPVKVFDAAGKPVNGDVVKKLGRGSIVRCNFQARAYMLAGMAGIVYDLIATQIVVPTWYTGQQDDEAFEPVEGGYVASPDEQLEF